MDGNAKYKLIAALGVTASIAVIIFSITIMVNRGREHSEAREDSEAREHSEAQRDERESLAIYDTEFDTHPFERIVVEGVWDVKVLPAGGSEPRIRLRASNEIIEYVEGQSGSTLKLELKSDSFDLSKKPEAVLYLDSLEEMRIEGASQMEFENMVFSDLLIRIDGAAEIEGNSSSVENLRISSEGAATVNFMDGSVKNAELSVQGMDKVDLMMTGGSLNGSIDGNGKVRYAGAVSDNDFEIDGSGSLEYID